MMPKGCDMDMLDKEFGRYLIAEYPASISDNTCYVVWIQIVTLFSFFLKIQLDRRG